MKIIIERHKKSVILIALLVSTAMSAQSAAWACNAERMLRQDVRKNMTEIAGLIEQFPEPDGPARAALDAVSEEESTGRNAKTFPGGISEDILKIFWDKYGNFGEIRGTIGTRGKERFFECDLNLQEESKFKKDELKPNFDDLIERLNALIPKLRYLPENTTIKIRTDGRYPLLYHKEEKVLELHAILLSDIVTDETLEYVARHEERHIIFEGIDEFWEEVINIYIDFLRLKIEPEETTGRRTDPVTIIDNLNYLEGEGGYWDILARREKAIGTEREQDVFLREIIEYVCTYQHTENPDRKKMDKRKDTEEKLQILMLKLKDPADPLSVFWKLARSKRPVLFEEIPLDKTPSPVQFVFLIAKVLKANSGFLHNWKEKEDDVIRKIEEFTEPQLIGNIANAVDFRNMERAVTIIRNLWMQGKIERVYKNDPGEESYFSNTGVVNGVFGHTLLHGYDFRFERPVYIPMEHAKSGWAKRYIDARKLGQGWDAFIRTFGVITQEKEGDLNTRRKLIKLRELWGIAITRLSSNPNQLEDNLKIATRLLNYNVDFMAVCAALIKGVDIHNLKAAQGTFTRQEIERINYLTNQADMIRCVPYYPRLAASHQLQNFINLLIQLSENPDGSPNHNIMLLVILNKLTALERIAADRTIYDNMTENERSYLETETMMVYAPLSEFLGVRGIGNTNKFRDLWLKITDPEEYERIEEEVVSALELEGVKYEDLENNLSRVREELQKEFDELGIKGIKVRSRVKSVYSIYEKILNNPKYDEVEDLDDLLGINIVFPMSNIYKGRKDEIRAVLKKVFIRIYGEDKKTPEGQGYDEDDFIGVMDDGLKMEVQLYPSKKDYSLYIAGTRAHWVYKMERMYSEYKFDVDFLQRIQTRLVGDYDEIFAEIVNALSPWVFAGTLVPDPDDPIGYKISLGRFSKDSIAPDLACARRIDELDEEYYGIQDVTDLKLDAEEGRIILPGTRTRYGTEKNLRPGIYEVVKRKNQSRSEIMGRFTKIKQISRKMRTYLTASKILDNELRRTGNTDGRGMFNLALRDLGCSTFQIARFLNSEEMRYFTYLIGAGTYDEFYEILSLLNRPSETPAFGRALKTLMHEAAGEEIGEKIDDRRVAELLNSFGLRAESYTNPRIFLIAYLMTSKVRGLEKLQGVNIGSLIRDKQTGVSFYFGENNSHLHLLLHEYGMDHMDQLYRKIGIYPEFIYNVLFKLLITGMPEIVFGLNSKEGVEDSLWDILAQEDIAESQITVAKTPSAGKGAKHSGRVSFVPSGHFTQLVISRIIDNIKRIPAVVRDNPDVPFTYRSGVRGKVVKKVLTAKVNLAHFRKWDDMVADAMNSLGIRVKKGRSKSKRSEVTCEYYLEVPEVKQMSAAEAQINLVLGYLQSVLAKQKMSCEVENWDDTESRRSGSSTVTIGISDIPEKPGKKGPGSGPALSSLLVLAVLPFITGFSGSLPFGDILFVVFEIVIISLIVYLGNKARKAEKLEKKKRELLAFWNELQKEETEDMELLGPFWEGFEHSIDEGIDFNGILQFCVDNPGRMDIQQVRTRVCDYEDVKDLLSIKQALPESAFYDVQGYLIKIWHENKRHEFFIYGRGEDIAYCDKLLNEEGRRGEVYVSLKTKIDDGGISKGTLEALCGLLPVGECRHTFLRVAAPMDPAGLREFCHSNIITRSVIERFPRTDKPYPAIGHDRYFLMPDQKGVAFYSTIGKYDERRGVITGTRIRDATGSDALHEICHGIYDYSSEFWRSIRNHFDRYPNVLLEGLISDDYGFNENEDLDADDEAEKDGDDFDYARDDLVNEEFAFTLSEFASMSWVWRDHRLMQEIGKEQDEMTIREIRDKLMSKLSKMKTEMTGFRSGAKPHIEGTLRILDQRIAEINALSRIYSRNQKIEKIGGTFLISILTYVGIVDPVEETRIRNRLLEISVELLDLSSSPPVRLLDVKFFAEAGLIAPWMNPLVLGYTMSDFFGSEIIGVDSSHTIANIGGQGRFMRTSKNISVPVYGHVNEEYYLRLIEFLYKRSRSDNEWYQIPHSGEWVLAPFGPDAFLSARRLARELITAEDLSDLTEEEYVSSMTNNLIHGIAEIESRSYISESIREFVKKVRDNKKRELELDKFEDQVNSGRDVSKYADGSVAKTQWLFQAYFERVILDRPKVLILDADIFTGQIDDDKLVELINQVKGRVVISLAKNYKAEEILNAVGGFISRNDGKFSLWTRWGLRDIGGRMYRHTGSNTRNYVESLFELIGERFEVGIENIAVFTTDTEFTKTWRRWNGFLRKTICYVACKNSIYVTSEQLANIQKSTGKRDILLQPGREVTLLPAELYAVDKWTGRLGMEIKQSV